jgi:D-arginine dehydrogenase
MNSADFLVIGGGVAGLSVGAGLASHGRVILLEAEEALGFHSSGRSATFAHFGIGDTIVRGLTAWSRSFFLQPPDRFSEVPLARTAGALFIARADALEALHALRVEMARFSGAVRKVDEAGLLALCPILRVGEGGIVAGVLDEEGLKLDSHALLQLFARRLRSSGSEIRTGARVQAVARVGERWAVETPAGRFAAPVLVNAAGAWADSIAALGGVQPLGLAPTRRTIIVVEPPTGLDIRSWPFVKTATDEFYMLPEGGQLIASPVDEEPDKPGDAQPDEYGVALAAHRLQEYTRLPVPRIAHRWAGLRTFAADRVPVAGYAADAPGFFWLAGQGGYGLQTAPAMAAAAEGLIAGTAWPAGLAALGISAASLSPDRFAALSRDG